MARYAIFCLRERPELLLRAAEWFHEKWGIPRAAYEASMRDCLMGLGAVPQWYVTLADGAIIAGAGVIENDFHERKDLAPNVCAVYVEEDWRGRGVARALLSRICADMQEKGVKTLYLTTDHTAFYEKLGWEFLCLVWEEGHARQTRMYMRKL